MKSEISVAPMEGVTIFPMRFWLHLASRPQSMTTPFLRVTQVYPEAKLPVSFAPELFELRNVLSYDLTPQFMACEPDNFLRAAALIPKEISSAIEFNCGCPTPNSAGKNAGSGILQNPDHFGSVTSRLSRELGEQRLAVKMRLGIEDVGEFKTLYPHVTSLPLARLTVHGRTRAARYKGEANWTAIQEAAVAAKSPTWASGDVFSAERYNTLINKAPSVKGVMIGRGLLHNPWIFEELRTSSAVQITLAALANALLCFAVLHELWLTAPEKLVSRIACGRINSFCDQNPEAWERLAAQLTGLLGGAPYVLSERNTNHDYRLSNTALGRLRYLWMHLRTSLPEDFQSVKMLRARKAEEFFTGLLGVPSGEAKFEIRGCKREL